MNVSIIIPAHNGEKTIGKVLQSVLTQEKNGEVEVLVVDDNSTDGTADICERYGVKVLHNENNLGLARTLNKGIVNSKYDIVVTLHQDCLPTSKDFLQKLTKPLEDRGVAASCSLVNLVPISTWDGFGIWEKLFTIRHLEAPVHRLCNKSDAYRRDVLEEVGMFDGETFRIAGEDADMYLKLRKKGIVKTEAKVDHLHHDGIWKLLRKDYVFGEAQGALRRKYPYYKPSPFDGLIRTVILAGCFIPYIQLICIPVLFYACLIGFRKAIKMIKDIRAIAYPALNLCGNTLWVLGFCYGLFTGKQKS